MNQSQCHPSSVPDKGIGKSSLKRKYLRLIMNELNRCGYPLLTRFRLINYINFKKHTSPGIMPVKITLEAYIAQQVFFS